MPTLLPGAFKMSQGSVHVFKMYRLLNSVNETYRICTSTCGCGCIEEAPNATAPIIGPYGTCRRGCNFSISTKLYHGTMNKADEKGEESNGGTRKELYYYY